MSSGLHLRVAVVSGSYGAGHDVVAGELGRRLVAGGAEVQRYDIAELLPLHVGQVLRLVYFWQLQAAPSTWTATLNLLDSDGLLGLWCRRMLAASRARLVRRVAGCDLVISTHPFASQVLGSARVQGELSSPVATYLTDASVHSLWVHSGVDLHVAIHEIAAQQAATHGIEAVVVDPVRTAGV
jgi:processive 1,2-diacylglycerol beta-glucosyltransferase